MEEKFLEIIKQNTDLMKVLDYLEELKVPNYCICTGSLNQTIWNYLDHLPLNHNIDDIDILFEDNDDLREEKEEELKQRLTSHFEKLNMSYKFDTHNIRIMDVWKSKITKKECEPFIDINDAIKRLYATIQAVGVTKKNGELFLYAPYGVEDIFTKTIRPIKNKENTKEQYEKKVKGWKNRFSNLNVIEWDEE